eukprot:CAMPEP_0168628772 /NCGR_PEP_ID=MMETSP0449_2-20121227/12031_1 /TAXON_ID=1082188 /ORGANISM="Strombidium rassoulzadegani, Strain ras09" /LENGTH=58 /DNA_ID=CAMNT_0008671231 /DNA_START=679 /DNA_END=855 /DNA_ORIENTATION=-
MYSPFSMISVPPVDSPDVPDLQFLDVARILLDFEKDDARVAVLILRIPLVAALVDLGD